MLKEFPNNTQIANALLTIGYRRKTPKTSQWSHQAKNFVKLAKTFKAPEGFVIQKISEKAMFKLAARAMDGNGALVWST